MNWYVFQFYSLWIFLTKHFIARWRSVCIPEQKVWDALLMPWLSINPSFHPSIHPCVFPVCRPTTSSNSFPSFSLPLSPTPSLPRMLSLLRKLLFSVVLFLCSSFLFIISAAPDATQSWLRAAARLTDPIVAASPISHSQTVYITQSHLSPWAPTSASPAFSFFLLEANVHKCKIRIFLSFPSHFFFLLPPIAVCGNVVALLDVRC